MLRRLSRCALVSSQSIISRNFAALPFVKLPYNSARIDVENRDVDDTAEFTTRLWETVTAAREAQIDALYLRVPLLYAHLMPSAALFGFRFHHAEGDMATLLLWLPPSECKVPPFATHHCGVGGAVLHEGKLLVVKERLKPTGWKLPGGYLNLGEDIEAGVAREVLEETGVQARSTGILSFRHQHNVQFGRSDLYVICRMEALSSALRVDAEIDEAAWMPLPEFRAQTKHPMLLQICSLLEKDSLGLQGERMNSVVPGKAPFTLYL